ncbi:MAG TPA: tyrosine--tRNA ligase [Alphaproteobacteria bacterium]|nr:tyrosine--tRNA ligase [Alphaproteobacteria bacterium]
MAATVATKLRSEFLRVVTERGYLHQCTDLEALDAKLAKGAGTAYIGFDATADSLHVGSLVQIMLLRWFQKTGNKPIALMGGGTTKVGDPSGKDESRKLLSEDDIARNIAGIQRIFDRFITFGHGPTDAILTNNAEWLDRLEYIAFLRDYGRHFSVNRMLAFDSVKLRLEREQPLSFLEFNYMILQAYDFLELARRHDTILQMGGSDQWGNIVNGVELGRRVDERELFGLTSPLITTATGEKMGKTARGAVWLTADKVSPYDYWQFWRNTADDDVGRFLRLFTELPLDEIARLERLRDAEINEAKKVLATEATALIHGRDAATEAAESSRRAFEEGASGAAMPSLDVAGDASLLDALTGLKFAASRSEARRLIRSGAVRLNDQPVSDELRALGAADFANGEARLQAGKKKIGRLVAKA